MFSFLLSAFRDLRITVIAFICGVMWASPSWAVNQVLLISTQETVGAGLPFIVNMQNELSGIPNTVLTTRFGDLSTPLALADLSGYDVVVAMSVYGAIDPSNTSIINQAVAGSTSRSFAFFLDTCCNSVSANLTSIVNNAANGAYTVSFGPSQANPSPPSPVNTSSAYASSFLTATPITGAVWEPFTNVPSNYILYQGGGVLPADNAYVVIFPQGVSVGACVYATSDASAFDPAVYNTSNTGKGFGAAFVRAATEPGGSCRPQPTVTKTFSPSSVNAGSTSQLTITIANPASYTITGLTLQDTLPTGLILDALPTTTCTGGTLTGAIGSGSLNLTGATLPVGGCTITATVRWPIALTCNVSLQNTINPTAGQFNTDNGANQSVATAALTCPAVPALSMQKTVIDLNGHSAASAGDTLRWTITLTNTGGAPATGVAVNDAIPTHTALITSSLTDGGTVSGSNILWPALSVSAGGSYSVSFDTTVDTPLPPLVTQLSNQATAGAIVSCDPNKPGCVATSIPVLRTIASLPVPALSNWATGLLGLLALILARAMLRRQHS